MQLSDADQNDEFFQKALAIKLAPFVGQRLGLAVSGGSDSRALLELVQQWAVQTKSQIFVATVDHGLRLQARMEAAAVAKTCLKMGITHETLTWTDWDKQGNLQAEARRARYRLLAAWAAENGLDGVALGHTCDDVAETFLMRLSRSAGVDGLSKMREEFSRNGALFLRPLLDFRREDLRIYLKGKGFGWFEDPSNQDTKFVRVKMRNALSDLGKLGLGTEKLSSVSENLGMASTALRYYAAQEAAQIAEVADCDVQLDYARFSNLPQDIQRRLLVAAVFFVAPQEYAPRSKAVLNVMSSISTGQRCTLSGCVFTIKENQFTVAREVSAASSKIECAERDEVQWDDRWKLSGRFVAGESVGALGEEGLKACPDWRLTKRNRLALLASPAIWAGRRLVAAPLAQIECQIEAKPMRNKEDFIRILLSH